ncbi:MAG: septation regulator SpoVG [Clostridiales bacterium]|nr:septation regulator SpoVG [Clostridiales bacterium]
MKITDVRIRLIDHDGRVRAVASITIEDEFVVHDIKIIEGTNGLFIAMPSRKGQNGEFRDIAHPISAETRSKIQDAILEAYNKEVEARK